MYNLDTINTRLHRLINYFSGPEAEDKELVEIISGGVASMPPNEIDNAHVNSGLEEARFSGNLVGYATNETIDQAKRDRMISLYVTRLLALHQKAEEYKGSPEKLNRFFTWSLDYGSTEYASIWGYAPIWVRQVDRLARDAMQPASWQKLSENARGQITKVYELYKSVPQGVDQRRERQALFEQGFDRLFPKEKYEELRQKIAPWGTDDLNRHVAKYLLQSHKGETEVEVQARTQALREYITVLKEHLTDPEAKELMATLKREYGSFHKNLDGELPTELEAVIKEGIQVFEQK